VNRPTLYVAIAVTSVGLGIFHYKIKPKPNAETVQLYADVMRSQTEWQGQIAPNFEITDTTGQRFRLADNIGKKIVVLNFFATWCEPCKQEMPELNRYFDQHNGPDFILLGLDIDEKSELVNSFLQELNITFPVGIDQGTIQKQYGVISFPTTILIGVDGRVSFYQAGAIANADIAFDNLLSENRSRLRTGSVISPADYLREAEQHPALPSMHPERAAPKSEAPQLDERGTRIAAAMGCPCGCDLKVKACVCATSKHIKDALAKEDFKNQPDDAIVKSLNKRFCSGPM
jgi:peroxiredoxin